MDQIRIKARDIGSAGERAALIDMRIDRTFLVSEQELDQFVVLLESLGLSEKALLLKSFFQSNGDRTTEEQWASFLQCAAPWQDIDLRCDGENLCRMLSAQTDDLFVTTQGSAESGYVVRLGIGSKPVEFTIHTASQAAVLKASLDGFKSQLETSVPPPSASIGAVIRFLGNVITVVESLKMAREAWEAARDAMERAARQQREERERRDRERSNRERSDWSRNYDNARELERITRTG